MKPFKDPFNPLFFRAVLRKEAKACVEIRNAGVSDVQVCVLGPDEGSALLI